VPDFGLELVQGGDLHPLGSFLQQQDTNS
jgi:hypothetical protein